MNLLESGQRSPTRSLNATVPLEARALVGDPSDRDGDVSSDDGMESLGCASSSEDTSMLCDTRVRSERVRVQACNVAGCELYATAAPKTAQTKQKRRRSTQRRSSDPGGGQRLGTTRDAVEAARSGNDRDVRPGNEPVTARLADDDECEDEDHLVGCRKS
jgi:hypothetical protein